VKTPTILEADANTTLQIKVLPRSSRNDIAGKENDIYRIKLTAPAVEGKANKALLSFLAKRLGIPKTQIQIFSGERSRTKSLRIEGLEPDDVEARLIHPS
jgi:uncharacterized protein (TIGR00251 family)